MKKDFKTFRTAPTIYFQPDEKHSEKTEAILVMSLTKKRHKTLAISFIECASTYCTAALASQGLLHNSPTDK